MEQNVSLVREHPFLLIFSVVFSFLLVSYVRSYLRLAHVPGPRRAGWSVAWMLKQSYSGCMAETLTDVNKRYGSLARIGPDHLLSSDFDLVRRMSAARSPYRRSYWYNGLRYSPGVDNLITIRDDRVHDNLRKKMASAYGGKENPGMEGIVEQRIEEAIDVIEQKYLETDDARPLNGRHLDLGRMAQYFTIDAVTSLAFGKPFGNIRDDEDKYGFIGTSTANMSNIAAMTIMPNFLKFVENSRILELLPKSAQEEYSLVKVLNATGPIIDERLENVANGEKVGTDMLGAFIRNGLSKQQLRSESILQVLAGSDTTATAIRSTLLLVISNSSVLTKLRAEFDNADISEPITDAEARRLPYLQAVIKEGLRMFPPAPGLFSKEVPAQGDIINGMRIPGGTIISHSMLALQRCPNTFHPDPYVFRPERWLTATPEHVQRMTQTVDLVFGYGKYQCLGKTIALLELNKIIVELLRRFDFAPNDINCPWNSTNAGLWMQSELFVRVTPRVNPNNHAQTQASMVRQGTPEKSGAVTVQVDEILL